MNRWVWFNRYLPQTLQNAVMIVYWFAAFDILFAGLNSVFYAPIYFLFIALKVLGAFGISNLRWWGYVLTIVFPFFAVASTLLGVFLGEGSIFNFGVLIDLIFNVAILALLLHPESRIFVRQNFEKKIP
jgi:hypothetical protein